MAKDKDKTNEESPSPEGQVGSLEKSAEETAAGSKGKVSMVKRLTGGLNLYLIAFGVILLVAGIVIFIAFRNNQSEPTITITGDELNDEILDELQQTETNIGDVTQTLTVEANAIFNGKILVKDNLDVAGSINVGGPLTLPGITVSGSSQFDDVEVTGSLSILGNTGIAGTLSVQNGISVTGNGTFTGSVSADSISAGDIELLGDLIVSRHIDTGGATPGKANGASIGSGGTTSVSGTDTAGTVTINTGSSPGTGSLIRVDFRNSYNSTPQVLITPVGSAAGGLEYYVTRTANSFTIYSRTAPVASTTYVFDYFVIE